ncbi:autophagy protein Apg17-domain-containing protein [Cristinia sonorae]|uniref:Autophagy-related protein 17 n=1 Tax=Cristinia sonorae TaxID=1940300 RepID=A0A8K0UM03_9AGAR|nr:autophagy protein Apg17-domain-containing protein [Cristinia sonorae]
MSVSPQDACTKSDQPHLVSLVLQSKKALQHGEQLCTRARTLSSESAQTAIDLMALDAKLKWVTEAVVDQLKLAAAVAKSIEEKRARLEKQVDEWDMLRSQRTDALDAILESLGSQVVPPSFHLASSDSSLFGSQHGSDDEAESHSHDEHKSSDDPFPGQSPTETLRNVLRNGLPKHSRRQRDRSKWKTLRDFVDERAIEEVLDTIENDRVALDKILARTARYPEDLTKTITDIQNNVATDFVLPGIVDIINAQEDASASMATLLTSLAQHYDQIVDALHRSEAGTIFEVTEIEDMNRDTDELPSVVSDLEREISSIHSSYEHLLTSKHHALQLLKAQRDTLTDLDVLADVMQDMLSHQQDVETQSMEHIADMHTSLGTIEDLHSRFTSYEYSYCKLLLELGRRRQYKEAAEKVVEGMLAQLEAMVEEEERLRRERFNAEYGDHLPSDVCLSIQNPPTRWEVVPWNHEPIESLPEMDSDLLTEVGPNLQRITHGRALKWCQQARSRIQHAEARLTTISASQSL